MWGWDDGPNGWGWFWMVAMMSVYTHRSPFVKKNLFVGYALLQRWKREGQLEQGRYTISGGKCDILKPKQVARLEEQRR